MDKEELDKLIDMPPAKKLGISMEFKDNPALFGMIDRYRRSLGWTWKRLFLIGFANTVAKNDDAPELVKAIAAYLENRR